MTRGRLHGPAWGPLGNAPIKRIYWQLAETSWIFFPWASFPFLKVHPHLTDQMLQIHLSYICPKRHKYWHCFDVNMAGLCQEYWADPVKMFEINCAPKVTHSFTIIILVTITATYIIIVVVSEFFLGSSVNWKFVNNWYYFLGVLTQKQDWNITIFFPLNSNLLNGQKKWRCFLSSQDILLYQAQILFLYCSHNLYYHHSHTCQDLYQLKNWCKHAII